MLVLVLVRWQDLDQLRSLHEQLLEAVAVDRCRRKRCLVARPRCVGFTVESLNCGAPFGFSSDGPERRANSALPRARHAAAPPGADRPQVGAELALPSQTRGRSRLRADHRREPGLAQAGPLMSDALYEEVAG
jgi:hypothetical protein